MINCFPRKLLNSIWIKELSRLIREEGLEAVQSEEESKNRQDKDTNEKDKHVMCTACHDLDDCSIFMSLTVEDRSKVLFRNKPCYGCYGCISKDHSARNCKQRRSCNMCKDYMAYITWLTLHYMAYMDYIN